MDHNMTNAGTMELIELRDLTDDSFKCIRCDNEAEWMLKCLGCGTSTVYCTPCKNEFITIMRLGLPVGIGQEMSHSCGLIVPFEKWVRECWRPV